MQKYSSKNIFTRKASTNKRVNNYKKSMKTHITRNTKKNKPDYVLLRHKNVLEQKGGEDENENAANTLKKFMLNTSSKRKAFFLKSICSDSGVCIAFGKENDKIKQLFQGFTQFKFVEPPIKRIGAESMNGFVNEIKYSRYEYHAYAVLKSCLELDNDNLMYEYIVGQYVNKLNKIYPCFVETYGLFLYKDHIKWSNVKKNNIVSTNILKDSIDIITPTYDIACTKSKYLAILIQHIKNATTLGSKINDTNFINHDLMNILFQIYIPLTARMNEFTHYDLHGDNILLYEPEKGKYIQYYYHFADGTATEFKSLYIAKIIDYGRSYFKDEKTDSKAIYKEMCEAEVDGKKICGSNCGEYYGFGWLKPEKNDGENDYIVSQKSNVSHDLLLARHIYIRITHSIPDNNPIKNILAQIVYRALSRGLPRGTNEIKESGIKDKKINNIQDLSIKLNQYVKEQQQKNNEIYAQYEKMGDLHVYMDGSRPMEFIR